MIEENEQATLHSMLLVLLCIHLMYNNCNYTTCACVAVELIAKL